MREADFYGAMDGASKFVRGDAIAGIIITLVNIVGGFAIGALEKGWTLERVARRLHPADDRRRAREPGAVVHHRHRRGPDRRPHRRLARRSATRSLASSPSQPIALVPHLRVPRPARLHAAAARCRCSARRSMMGVLAWSIRFVGRQRRRARRRPTRGRRPRRARRAAAGRRPARRRHARARDRLRPRAAGRHGARRRPARAASR